LLQYKIEAFFMPFLFIFVKKEYLSERSGDGGDSNWCG